MTLAESGRWTPVDGYGTVRQTVSATSPVDIAIPESEVTVLKLHAGVGWKHDELDPNGRYPSYLSYAYLLQFVEPVIDGSCVEFRDRGPENQGDIHGRPLEAMDDLFVIPSYLKAVPKGDDMQAIWNRSARAINDAGEVEV